MKVLKSAKVKEQPTKDNYFARVVGVTNIGNQPGFVWQGEDIGPSRKVEVTFELVTTNMADGRPFHVSKEFANSVDSKNTQALFLACNIQDMDWDLLINKPCMITIDLNGKGYATIKNVAGVPTGTPVPELRNSTYIFDIYSDTPDLDMFNSFSDFKKNKIKDALDFNSTKLAQELALEATDEDM